MQSEDRPRTIPGKSQRRYVDGNLNLQSQKYFHHNLQVIYADKVAQVIDGDERVIIIRNQSFAQTARNTFDLIWSQSKPPSAPSRRHEK